MYAMDLLRRSDGSLFDCPAGRVDRVPSRVSGQILSYFTPASLPELLARYRPCSGIERIADPGCSLALVAIASRRNGATQVDAATVRGLLAAMRPQASPPDHEALLASARAVTPRANGLRNEIVFSGARVAGEGHVFADSARVPELFAQIQVGLAGPLDDLHPTVVAALLGFNALHLHPFLEGNGRWTRRLIVATASRMGTAWTGLAHAALLNIGKHLLVTRLWPRARSEGLGAYIEACLRFDASLRDRVAGHPAAAGIEMVQSEVERIVRVAAARDAMYAQLLAGPLPIQTLRQAAGTSRRVIEGALARIAGMSLIEVTPTHVSLHSALAQLDDLVVHCMRDSLGTAP